MQLHVTIPLNTDKLSCCFLQKAGLRAFCGPYGVSSLGRHKLEAGDETDGYGGG